MSATHCLHHTATHCNILRHTARLLSSVECLQLTVGNTLQHIATHCSIQRNGSAAEQQTRSCLTARPSMPPLKEVVGRIWMLGVPALAPGGAQTFTHNNGYTRREKKRAHVSARATNTDTQIDRRTNTARQRNRQADRQTGRQVDRQTDIGTHTDRHIHTHTHTHVLTHILSLSLSRTQRERERESARERERERERKRARERESPRERHPHAHISFGLPKQFTDSAQDRDTDAGEPPQKSRSCAVTVSTHVPTLVYQRPTPFSETHLEFKNPKWQRRTRKVPCLMT